MTTWTTYDGRKLDFEHLSQQHLSNIFWYSLLVSPNLHIRVKAINALDSRDFKKSHRHEWSDSLLDYRPVSEAEIKYLRTYQTVVNDVIWHRNKTIGVIDTPLDKVIQEIKKEIGI
jgi:hypothetical protein